MNEMKTITKDEPLKISLWLDETKQGDEAIRYIVFEITPNIDPYPNNWGHGSDRWWESTIKELGSRILDEESYEEKYRFPLNLDSTIDINTQAPTCTFYLTPGMDLYDCVDLRPFMFIPSGQNDRSLLNNIKTSLMSEHFWRQLPRNNHHWISDCCKITHFRSKKYWDNYFHYNWKVVSSVPRLKPNDISFLDLIIAFDLHHSRERYKQNTLAQPFNDETRCSETFKYKSTPYTLSVFLALLTLGCGVFCLVSNKDIPIKATIGISAVTIASIMLLLLLSLHFFCNDVTLHRKVNISPNIKNFTPSTKYWCNDVECYVSEEGCEEFGPAL